MSPSWTITNPSIAVIGPGAIGSFLAAKLSRTGRSIFLVGRNLLWLARARKHGIFLSGVDFGRKKRLPNRQIIPIIKPPGQKCEFVCLCVKSDDTAEAIRKARHWVGPSTLVISLLNGLTHRSRLLSAFGTQRTVFGICYLATERRESNYIHHHGGSIIALAKGRNNAAAVRKAQSLFMDAGFNVKTETSEDRLLWTKAAFNAATNPLGALTGRTNGELADIPSLRELMLRTLKEAVTAARANKHPIAYAPLEHRLLAGMRSTPHQPNSMLQDLRAGRPTEIDAIVKPFLQAARKKHLKTPILESLYRFTCRLDRELRLKHS